MAPTKSTEADLDFLRSRGVQIETAASRNADKELLSVARTLKKGDPDTVTFSYCIIPADDSQPISEESVTIPKKFFGNGDVLVTLLKRRFTSGANTIDRESLKKSAAQSLVSNQAAQDMMKSNGQKDINIDSLTRKAISNASEEGSVETFRLGKEENLYLDEVGAFKALDKNRRASFLAAQCGFGDVPFFGDIFIGRTIHDPASGKIMNGNIAASEVDIKNYTSIPWIKTAVEHNMKNQGLKEEIGMAKGMSADEITTKGGKGEGYTWSQGNDEVEIIAAFDMYIKEEDLPSFRLKGKDVKVKFSKRSAEVRYLGVLAFTFPDLFSDIVPDNSTWSIVDNKLVITLSKAKEGLVWPSLV